MEEETGPERSPNLPQATQPAEQSQDSSLAPEYGLSDPGPDAVTIPAETTPQMPVLGAIQPNKGGEMTCPGSLS